MEDGSTVINQLLNMYSLEGIAMPYTMEQFRKEYVKAHLPELGADEVLSMFTPDDRLRGLAPKDRLESLAPEEKKNRFLIFTNSHSPQHMRKEIIYHSAQVGIFH
jgi:hypothetical protein